MGQIAGGRECTNDNHLDKVVLCDYECDGLVCSKCSTTFAGKKVCLECKLIINLKFGDSSDHASIHKSSNMKSGEAREQGSAAVKGGFRKTASLGVSAEDPSKLEEKSWDDIYSGLDKKQKKIALKVMEGMNLPPEMKEFWQKEMQEREEKHEQKMLDLKTKIKREGRAVTMKGMRKMTIKMKKGE